jgi:hypothetical protein
VAAFRHASSEEIAALEAEVGAIGDPWDQLETILTRSLTGYEPAAPDAGRHDAGNVAVLAVAAADGMGIPLSLGDPDITAASAVHDVMATLREHFRN